MQLYISSHNQKYYAGGIGVFKTRNSKWYGERHCDKHPSLACSSSPVSKLRLLL